MATKTTPPSNGSNGDASLHRELITEVKNLNAQVGQLHTVFVKRKVLYIILGIESFIVVAALVAFGILLGIDHSNQNSFINKSFGTCQTRNAQNQATRTYLQRQLTLQQESQGITAAFLSQLNVHFTPAQQKQIVQLTLESQKALHDYFVSQPKPIDCGKLKS